MGFEFCFVVCVYGVCCVGLRRFCSLLLSRVKLRIVMVMVILGKVEIY